MNIQISIPDDDGLGLKGVIPITVNVQPLSGLKYVRILIDGNQVIEHISGPYTYNWDTTKVNDGTHIVQAVAQYKTRKSTAQIAVIVKNSVIEPPPPPPPPPPGITSSLGFIRWGDGKLGTNIDKYRIIGVSESGFPAASNLPNRTVTYVSGSNINKYYFTGVPYSEAKTNGWVLKDNAGNEIYNKGYPGNVLGDVGNPDYQYRWCELVENRLRNFGCDGMFNDDVINYGSMWWNVPPTKYSGTSWDDAIVSFCKFVYEWFNSKGFYVSHNCHAWLSGDNNSNNGVTKMRFWNRVAPYSHGLMFEYWMYLKEWGYGVRKVGPAWTENWDNYRAFHNFCNGEQVNLSGNIFQITKPIDFLALDSVEIDNLAVQTYTTATHLLDWKKDGSSMIIWRTDGGNDPWTSVSDKVFSLGIPTNSATKNGNIWTRNFANGNISVDPINGTASILIN